MIKGESRNSSAIKYHISENNTLENQEFKDLFLINIEKENKKCLNFWFPIKDESLPVVLRRLKFRYDFRVGSLNSINFHQALSETKDEDCFTTVAVQTIL